MKYFKTLFAIITVGLLLPMFAYGMTSFDFEVDIMHVLHIEGQEDIGGLKRFICTLMNYNPYEMYLIPDSGEIAISLNNEEVDKRRNQPIIEPASVLLLNTIVYSRSDKIDHNIKVVLENDNNPIISHETTISLCEAENTMDIRVHLKEQVPSSTVIKLYIDGILLSERNVGKLCNI